MEYTIERVRALAQTARITLSREEEERLCRELGALHAIAEVLERAPIDSEADDPLLGAIPLSAWREDRAVACDADQTADGYFRVPRAVEE